MRYALLLAAVSWTITLTPPSDVKANYDAPLQVHVKDDRGAPVKNANVELTVTMVEMDHGESKHAAKESAPGAYDANAKFYMVGTWNVKVKAEKGGQSAVKDFKVEVKH